MNTSPCAVVLAGVHDWGACVLNKAVVRPLAPIANRPVVQHVLSALARAGVDRTVVCANGHATEMRLALGDDPVPGMQISYRDESMPRGPAGCAKDAAAELGDGDVVVVEATLVPHFDIERLLSAHRDTGAALTIATQPTRADEDQALEPVGMYVFSPEVFSSISNSGFQDIKEGIIPKLHAAGARIDIFPIDGVAPRLFGIASYFSLNGWALKQATTSGWELDGYVLEGSAMVHVDARVDQGVRLLGPVLVGPGAVLRGNALVVGPTSVDRNCIIGERAVVSRSALWAGSVVGAGAQLDRCLLARGARVGTNGTHFNSVCLASEETRNEKGNGAQTNGTRVPDVDIESRITSVRRSLADLFEGRPNGWDGQSH